MSLVLYLLQIIAELILAFGAEVLFLIALGVFALLIAAVMAPLGTLSWWAGWSDVALMPSDRSVGSAQHAPGTTHAGKAQLVPLDKPVAAPQRVSQVVTTSADKLAATTQLVSQTVATPADKPVAAAQLAPLAAAMPATNAALAPKHFLVYLSGIGDISADHLADIELAFVRRLAAELPDTRIIHNVFPYSVTNEGLVEEGDSGFWTWVVNMQRRGGRLATLAWLINLRNLLQVTVSADRRYGPVYNFGLARSILHSLEAAGYEVGGGTPLTLFGYSGGGQIVLASSEFLQPALSAPLQIISMGGVMADCPGLDVADEIVHLQGTLDGVQRLGDYVFPRRWPIARRSRWNRALACGKLRRIDMGPMTHNGARCYIDAEACLPDGRHHLDATTAQVVALIQSYLARVTPNAGIALRSQHEQPDA